MSTNYKKAPSLRLVSSNQPPAPPTDSASSIHIKLDNNLLENIAVDQVTFRERLQTVTDTSRIFIQADRDFTSLKDIQDFALILDAYVTAMHVSKVEIKDALRETWFNLYDLLDEQDGINLQLTLSYNIFGIGLAVTMTVEDDITIYDNDLYFDTSEQPPFTVFCRVLQLTDDTR